MNIHRRNHGRLLSLSVLALGALVVATAFAAPGDRRSTKAKHARNTVFSQEFSLASGGELRVDVDDMDIHVRTREGGKSLVEVFVSGPKGERAREYFEDLNFEAHTEGSTLIVESRESSHRGIRFWRRPSRVYAWAVLTVPRETAVDIDTEDGDIRLDDLEGMVRVQSRDGDLEVAELRGPSIAAATSDGDIVARFLAADEVTLTTRDGDVQTDRVEGGRVRVSTSDGDIYAPRIEAVDISIETSDGDVEVGVSGDKLDIECSDGDIDLTIHKAMEIDLRANDGDVQLTVPKNVGADLDLRGGHVSVRSKIAIRGNVSRRTVKGALNDGGPRIRVTTSDGSILIREG